jgi:hypothetical protein
VKNHLIFLIPIVVLIASLAILIFVKPTDQAFEFLVLAGAFFVGIIVTTLVWRRPGWSFWAAMAGCAIYFIASYTPY